MIVLAVRRRPAVVDVAASSAFLSATPHIVAGARGRWRDRRAALRWSAMTEHNPGTPLGAWLADLPDERLIRLLELRPDLTQPPPGSIAALAARAQSRQSVKAATDELDFLRLAVLDALLVLHADDHARAADQAGRPDRRPRRRGRRRRRPRRPARARAGVGRRRGPGGRRGRGGPALVSRARPSSKAPSTPPTRSPTGSRRWTTHSAICCERLVEGSPMGRTRDAAPGTPPDRPGAATAGRGSAAAGRRRNRDPAASGRSGAARRGSRTGRVDPARPRGVDDHRRRRRRGRGRRGHRPAARSRAGPRNPRRRTGSRTSQRRPRRA